MTTERILTLLGALIGGGAMTAGITAFVNRKKTAADAANLHMQSAMALNQSMAERISRLEARVAAVENENTVLQRENLRLQKTLLKHGIEYAEKKEAVE